MPSPGFTTRRLRLARLTLSDVEELARERPDIEGGRVSDAAKRWLAASDDLDPRLGGAWSIRRRLTDRLLGCLMFLVRADYGLPEVSFMIRPAHRRQGFAQEALEALVRHLEVDLGFSAVLAEVALQNSACQGLLRRGGFIEVPSEPSLTVGLERQPASLWCRTAGLTSLRELTRLTASAAATSR